MASRPSVPGKNLTIHLCPLITAPSSNLSFAGDNSSTAAAAAAADNNHRNTNQTDNSGSIYCDNMTTNGAAAVNGNGAAGDVQQQQQQQQQQPESAGGTAAAGGGHVSRERVKKKGLLLGIKSPFKFGSGKKKEQQQQHPAVQPQSSSSGAPPAAAAPPAATAGGGNSSNGNNNNESSSVVAAKQAVEVVDRVRNGLSRADSKQQDICSGCVKPLGDGHALMALDQQYHVWCFKCAECKMILQGEYMGKDGKPYCEKDYQGKFGVKCTYCGRFISGKVLQAGNNNHFHPTCARCTKCGDPFGDGEEMFLQGAAIWHPRCGPGPDESGQPDFPPGFGYGGGADPDGGAGDDANSVVSGPFFPSSRASSPGAGLRRGGQYDSSGRFSRSTTHVYPGYSSFSIYGGGGGSRYGLYNAASCYSLRRPVEPGDRVDSIANINHFHLPASRRSASTYISSRHAPLSAAGGMPRAPSAAANAASAAPPPPRPGYTSADPRGGSRAISPGPGMHFGDYEGCSAYGGDDVTSRRSYR